jgi:hypothetical protein
MYSGKIAVPPGGGGIRESIYLITVIKKNYEAFYNQIYLPIFIVVIIYNLAKQFRYIFIVLNVL